MAAIIIFHKVIAASSKLLDKVDCYNPLRNSLTDMENCFKVLSILLYLREDKIMINKNCSNASDQDI